jgi:hypothetical protein
MSIRVVPVTALLVIAAYLAACDNPASEQPPMRKLTYADDVEPILQKHCAECHESGKQGAAATGFRVDSYASVMQDTRTGPVIDPGSPMTSSLYILVSGKDKLTVTMPHGRQPLGAEEIETIRVWIENGAVEK